MDRYNPKSIKDAMKKAGLDINGLVVELEKYSPKVSRTLILGWLGGSCPSAVYMYALSKILNLELDDFFTKATKKEVEEYLVKRDIRTSKRRMTQKKFDKETADNINAVIKKIDKMDEALKTLERTKKKKGRKK